MSTIPQSNYNKTVNKDLSAIELAKARAAQLTSPFTPTPINSAAPRDVVKQPTKLQYFNPKTRAIDTVIHKLAPIRAKKIQKPGEPLVIDDKDELIYELCLAVIDISKTSSNQAQMIVSLTDRINSLSKIKG